MPESDQPAPKTTVDLPLTRGGDGRITPAASPPLTRGCVVDFRFAVDGQVVTRSAVVVDVANPGDPAPIADLHVFYKPGELPGSFIRRAAWDPTGTLSGTWSWPQKI